MISTTRRVLAFVVTGIALLFTFFFAANAGSLQVSFGQLMSGLFVEYDESVSVIFDLRFPRIFVAMIGGAATAVSGVLLQASIRNPLADPGIIGVSSAASLVAVIVSACAPALLYLTPLLSCAGGMLAFLIVYGLSWRDGLSPLRIILVGIAVSTMCTGLATALNEGTGSTLTGVASLVDANITLKTWADLQTLVVYVVIGLVLAVVVAGRCDLLALEDKTARSLGLNVNRNRMGVSAIAVLLAAASTAVIGPITFLGLIVPHCARILVGTSHKVLIPYSMLLGAFCLLVADTVGRTIVAPYEISAAVIMSIVGGPLFILLLLKARDSYGK